MVLAAAERSTPQAEQALEEICRTYWFPIYAYVRRRGHSPQDAEDLTQAFFLQFIRRHWIGDVDRAKGRLRAFLVTALKRFMVNEWRRATAQKRGGTQVLLSIDAEEAEGRYIAAGTPRLAADALFDRQWALTLLELTTKRLEAEHKEAGKDADFAVLKDSLVLAHGAIDYATIAGALGISEGAARVAVHRLRKRFRELYREEVALTLPAGADADEEMLYLASCLV